MKKRVVVWGTGFVGKLVIPEIVKHDASPCRHASVIGVIQWGGFFAICGHTHGVIAVEQTSIPARRNCFMSRMLSRAYAAVGP